MYQKQQHAGELAAAAMKKNSDQAHNLLSAYDKLNPGKALDEETTKKLIAIYPELNGMVDVATATAEDYAAALKKVNDQKAMEVAQDYIKKIQNEQDAIRQLTESQKKLGTNTISVGGQQVVTEKGTFASDIHNMETGIAKYEEQANAALAAVGKRLNEYGYIIDVPVTVSPPTPDKVEETISGIIDVGEKVKKTELQLLQEKLAALGETEAQAEAARLAAFTSFAAARADAEKLNGEGRIAFLQEQQALVLENFQAGSVEYLSAQGAFNAMILEEDRALAKERMDLAQTQLSSTDDFFESMGTIAAAAGVESRGLAIAQKAVATVQAIINTYTAANAALAAGGGIPWGLIPMTATIVAGLANVAKINSTKIPSAETGGSFMVPEVGRVDGALMRVNSGERVDVTPAGMAGGAGEQAVHFQFVFDSQVLYDVINRGARAGELHNLQLAGNI
jgi:hypothetical protein